MGGILPGPRTPKNINTYLEPLIDELCVFGEGGTGAKKPNGEAFTLYAYALLFIADYRGAAKVLCQKGSGATLGCIKCEIEGQSESKTGKKKVYGDFRRFLPRDHAFRRDVDTFGRAELRQAPPLRSHDDILKGAFTALAAEQDFGVKPSSVSHPSKVTGVTGFSELLRFWYWDQVERSPVEVMHVVVRLSLRCFLFLNYS